MYHTGNIIYYATIFYSVQIHILLSIPLEHIQATSDSLPFISLKTRDKSMHAFTHILILNNAEELKEPLNTDFDIDTEIINLH